MARAGEESSARPMRGLDAGAGLFLHVRKPGVFFVDPWRIGDVGLCVKHGLLGLAHAVWRGDRWGPLGVGVRVVS